MMMDKVSRAEKELYILANIIAENRNGRKVILWGNSNELKQVLKNSFQIEVFFRVTIREGTVNGSTIRRLEDIKGKKDEYYLVSWDQAYQKYYDNLLHEYGFVEVQDYIYRRIKPIIIEKWDCSQGKYEDQYGNIIEGVSGIVKKITFNGYNNKFTIGKDVKGLQNVELSMGANGIVEIGEGVCFNNGIKFSLNGYNGSSSIYIGRWCRFDTSFFRLFNHMMNSAVIIGDNCTFEQNVDFRANSGKKIVIGRDCMFSRDIQLQSGDGHSIFDIHTGQNINTFYKESERENNILFIGEHVWVGARVFILNGTYIGNGSVVGAGSVVKNRFSNNCVITGNPAKLAKEDIAWSREGYAEKINSSVKKEYALETNEVKPAIYGCNVLVVGGTRFMGLQLVKELLSRGNRVTIATRGMTKDPFGERIDRIVMDLDDPQTVKKALEGKCFDVVFDNLAYCSNYVKEILDNVQCRKYIQLSSVAVYIPKKENIKEDYFDANTIEMEWSFVNDNYARGKRNAEAAVVHSYPQTDFVIVRIPYVSKTKRLYYYCSHIVNSIPMKIEDVNRGFTFVRDTEVGKFLPWIAAQDFVGTINLASTGVITLKELINYIENKVGGKAIYYTDKGDESPFNEPTYYLDMSRASSLGYVTSSLDEWFWAVIDEYIAMAIKEKNAILTSNNTSINQVGKRLESKRTVDEVDINLCTGCGACKNICPQNAIELYPNEEGFSMPVIDNNKCVLCGLCQKVCPTFSKATFLKQNIACYALMAKDEVRDVSSSGGAFTLLAEKILKAGGVVCGAAWEDEYHVKQVIIQNIEQIDMLRGSKYVQSDTGFSFRQVKEILDKGKQVLYVGTPCQIDGLLHYLQKDYKNLITVDLLCRGNASNELFARFLKENYGDKTVKTINFKDKKPLGWGATTSYLFYDGNVEKTNTHNSIWMCAFLADFMDRRSCYRCKFNVPNRVGDISIGDFWGIEKYKADLNDRKGTSIVITSTKKGNELVYEIIGNCKVLKKVSISAGIPYNSALSHPVRMTPKREQFFESIKKMPISAAVDRTIYGEAYGVGIIGWWYNLNYGGTLTYYALNNAIKKLGYSVLMIRRSSSGPVVPNENTVPMKFAKKHYKISRLYTERDMHWLNYSCHAFISGSDQLWNPYLEQYSGPEYYLSFVNNHNLKLSYASSFGSISEMPEEFIKKYMPYLKRFDGISVREDYAVEICNKNLGLSTLQLCDPIFLCDRKQYEELTVDSTLILPDDYLLNFLLDPSDEKVDAYGFVQQSLGLINVVNFTDLQDVEKRVQKFGEDGALGNAEIEDFVNAFCRADFVITDSFHGTCLAIIFNKPFISIANKQRGEKRFVSLMNWLGLSNRLVYSVDELYSRPDLLEPIDFEEINKTIEVAQEQGYDWLKTMLNKMV